MGCFLMPMPTQSLKPCTLGGPGLEWTSISSIPTANHRRHTRARLSGRKGLQSLDDRSLWSGDDRYLHEYWSTWDDVWDHGDWAQKDEDGLWFLHGRADDALNVAGRKVGPAEVEGAASSTTPSIRPPPSVCRRHHRHRRRPYAVLEDGSNRRTTCARNRAAVGEEQGKPFRPANSVRR